MCRAKTSKQSKSPKPTRRQSSSLGLSERTWERLEALGDTHPRRDFHEGRVGYRVRDIAAWLDARREVQTARELIDANWKQVGAAASKIVERLR